MNLNYRIEFDIAGLIIDFLILLVVQKLYGTSSKNNRRFKSFLLVCIVSGIFDIITAYTISNSSYIPVFVNFTLNYVYLFTAFYTAYLVHEYLILNLEYDTKLCTILRKGVFYLFVFSLFLNLIFALLREFNVFDFILLFDFKGRTYNKGVLFYLNFALPCYYLFHSGYLLVYKGKYFTAKQRYLCASIFAFPLVAVIIQILMPEYLMTFFSYSSFTFVILFSLETPDFQQLKYLRENLENEVKKQTSVAYERQLKIQKLSIEIVETLAQAIDEKDEYTNGHSRRVSEYSVLLANELAWSSERIENLRVSALLHDVGKIGIPDSILQKPGKLTDEEFKFIQSHAARGGKILKNVSSLPIAAETAKHHHERFDGTGYPSGIAGTAIPDYARVVSIADAYDAMNSRRVYRDSLPKEEIRRRLVEGSGTQFDPVYLEAFLVLFDKGLV